MKTDVDIVKIHKIKQESTGYKRYIAKVFLNTLYGKFVDDLNEDKDYIERNIIMKNDLNLKKFYNAEKLTIRHGDMVCIFEKRRQRNGYIYKEDDPVSLMLTPKEKEYLSNVIKPFKDRVKNIHKLSCFGQRAEAIAIDVEMDKDFALQLCDTIYLPIFKKGTMYKNLTEAKLYTLKELGLN